MVGDDESSKFLSAFVGISCFNAIALGSVIVRFVPTYGGIGTAELDASTGTAVK